MRKVKTKKKLIPLLLAIIATFSIFLYAKSISAETAVNEEASVKLNIEKVDRDTIKISLDNFEPTIKSLQFGLKIDGNAKFVEDGVRSLVTSSDENMKTAVKLSDDKKGLEIFIVSTEVLDRKATSFEICEVDLEKATNQKSGFSITPYSLDSTDTAITYILSDTNKREEQVLATEAQVININSAPTIELKESKFIIDGEIILTKGKAFNAEDYVTITDEDGTVEKVEYTGTVKINTVGVYNVTYTATDDFGDSTSLQVPVVVEDASSNPIINIDNSQIVDSVITVNEGEEINLLEGIGAYDFRGRSLEVKIVGDYNFNTAGNYPLTLVAEDIHGNTTEVALVLVVKGQEQPISNPIITVANKTINIKKGETVDLLEGVNAVDYLGQPVTVDVSVYYAGEKIESINGAYSFDKIGEYTIKYNAEDELGNKAEEVTAILTVEEEQETEPTPPSEPSNPGESEGETDPSEPSNPGAPEISLPDDIINIGGNGTEENPTVYETEKIVALNQFVEELQNKFKVVVTNRTILNDGTQKYSIRLENKGVIARLFGRTNEYYFEIIVPNTDEFTSVFSKLDKEDKEAPILEYNGELNITLENGEVFEIPEVIAKDNLDTNVTVKVAIKNSDGKVIEKIDTTKADKYTITYTAEDESGNKAKELVITVIVNEANATPQPPVSEDKPTGDDATNNEENPSKPGETGGETKPSVPVNPEQIENQENIENDKTNDLPATGQGVYFGITVFVAILIVGAGIFMFTKSKKKK